MTTNVREAIQKKASQAAKGYLPIEDYAPIGDLHTVALVE